MLKLFWNVSIYKEFSTEKFVNELSLSSLKKSKTKKYIVIIFHELKNSKIIEHKVQVLMKQGTFKKVTELTANRVSKSIF